MGGCIAEGWCADHDRARELFGFLVPVNEIASPSLIEAVVDGVGQQLAKERVGLKVDCHRRMSCDPELFGDGSEAASLSQVMAVLCRTA